jgi:hypothetical protein
MNKKQELEKITLRLKENEKDSDIGFPAGFSDPAAALVIRRIC